jgi:2'-5' RNA ligase
MPRLFVAVDLPPSAEPTIRDLQSRLAQTNADVRFTDPSQAHFTLAFIGNKPADRIPAIEKVMRDVVASHEPFEVTVEGLGVFPDRDYISVVWVGVSDGREPFAALQAELEDRLVAEGIATEEEHDFVPHVTLGRMNSGRGKSEVQRFLDERQDVHVCEATVSSIVLKESDLTDTGSVHSPVFEVALEG